MRLDRLLFVALSCLLIVAPIFANTTDLTGTWSGNITEQLPCPGGGSVPATFAVALSLQQSGTNVSGPLTGVGPHDACISQQTETIQAETIGTLNGSTLSGQWFGGGQQGAYSAAITSATTMTLTFTFPDGVSAIGTLTKQSAGSSLCNLGIKIICNQQGNCTAVTTNNGATQCSGVFVTGFETPGAAAGSLTNFSSGLTGAQCSDSSTIPGATLPFVFCFGQSTLGAGASFTGTVHVTGTADQPVLAFSAFADSNNPTASPMIVYAYATAQTPTCTPTVSAPTIAQTGSSYRIYWSLTSNPNTQYQIDESTTSDFSANVTSQTVSGFSTTFTHSVTSNTNYYYRVRATSCNGGPGPFSTTVTTVVQAQTTFASNAKTGADVAVPVGSTDPVAVKMFIPSPTGKTGSNDVGFSAGTDKPYITVSPSSGTIPAGGTTVTVTANPALLPTGANTGTVTVTTPAGTSNVPLSVSVVTPVAPGAKSLPPGNALIIPVVTHVNGASSSFFSDLRLTNASSSTISYQLTFTPTRTNGTTSSKVTNVTVNSSQTVALNDIVKDFFGYGATGASSDVGFGALEIRPLATSSNLTYASSRTYASTAQGTFGQFIAAIPFAKFIGSTGALSFPGVPVTATPKTLSLQQIAQSTKFRTNLGIAEGSGSAASGSIRVYDDDGTLLKTVPFSLLPGEHQQLNSFLATNGIASLEDGRIEITVESSTGAVSAYASVLDNLTTDPLAVMPAIPPQISATRFILPGIADLNNGAANFHSDIRIYNGGSSPVTLTPTYYPQSNPGGATAGTAFTVAPGKVKTFDNALPAMFNVTNSGGSILFIANAASSVVITGRTYSIDVSDNPTKGGTFGQFIPGVTPTDGIGAGDKPLQILQLEQSANFRSNLGLVELTGNPVHVRISLYLPDSKVTPTTELDLAANEFRQLSSVIAGLNPGSTYNARISVEVVSGTGRVSAYGSVIDNATNDPTYVPAQ